MKTGAAGAVVSEIANDGGFNGGSDCTSGSCGEVKPAQARLASGGQDRRVYDSSIVQETSPSTEKRSSSSAGSGRGDAGGGSVRIPLDESRVFVSQEVPEEDKVSNDDGVFLAEANDDHARSPAASLIQGEVFPLSDCSVLPAAAEAAPLGGRAATRSESERFLSPWSEWEAEASAAVAAPGPEQGRAAALRIGSTRGFFAALTDVLLKSARLGGEAAPQDGNSGNGSGGGGGSSDEYRRTGNPLPLLRAALRTAERVASAAVLLSSPTAPSQHRGVDGAGTDLDGGPAGAPEATPRETAAAVAGRFLHALLPLVRLCDCLLEGDIRAGGRGAGGGDREREEEARVLFEAVRLLGVMVRMPWWSREAALGMSGRDRQHSCEDAGTLRSRAAGGDVAAGVAGGCAADPGQRGSVVGISERWTLLSTLTSLLRPESCPFYPGTSQQVSQAYNRCLCTAGTLCELAACTREAPSTVYALLSSRVSRVAIKR